MGRNFKGSLGTEMNPNRQKSDSKDIFSLDEEPSLCIAACTISSNILKMKIKYIPSQAFETLTACSVAHFMELKLLRLWGEEERRLVAPTTVHY